MTTTTERQARRDAVLSALSETLLQRLRALTIAVRREQDEHAEREKLDLLDTTALAALSMAERTLEEIDNQLEGQS